MLVVDPCTGRPRAPGGVGEVWVRGPGVTAGYWLEDTSGRRAFAPNGYLGTGHLGALHEGELYVTGRLAEAVTVRGRTLYPLDNERESGEPAPLYAACPPLPAQPLCAARTPAAPADVVG